MKPTQTKNNVFFNTITPFRKEVTDELSIPHSVTPSSFPASDTDVVNTICRRGFTVYKIALKIYLILPRGVHIRVVIDYSSICEGPTYVPWLLYRVIAGSYICV